MISAMNIPTDSPKEFYASRCQYLTEPCPTIEIATDSSLNTNNNIEKTNIPKIKFPHTSSYSIFYRRKCTHRTEYLPDGRKVYDGHVLHPASVQKLWRQLIVRKMVHKMEDEIEDPIEQISKLNDSLPILSKGQSASTYSLVSQNRLESQCDKCDSNKIITHWRQIAQSSVNLFEDFIPSCPTCSIEPKTKGNKYLSPNETNYPPKRYRSNSTFS